MPNFDPIARPYRYLEYLTLGSALQNCRLHHLPHLLIARRALILGDGDGRFLARLLARNPHLHADVVDLSPAMLHQLRNRTRFAADRTTLHQADARSFQPTGLYDLVATHFFLDCLTDPELDLFATRLAPHLAPDALWVLSDFRIPPGILHLPARALVRLLYLAFRLLTGLRTTRLPDHGSALHRAGLTPTQIQRSLFGILTSELWQHHPSAPLTHPTPISHPSEVPHPMTTPSPVPDIPPTPGPDLPTGPASDPIPNPEPASPSLPDPDPGVFHPHTGK